MDAYLAVVSPYLRASIASREAVARIRTVAARLPPCSLAGLELRLREDRPDVDLFVRLPYTDPGLDPSLTTDPVWQAVQRLCDAVATPGGPLHEQVRFVFLEFDLNTTPSQLPIPGLFLELETSRTLGGRDLLALVGSLGLGHQDSVSGDVLERCVTALPSGAQVAHLGLMPGRPGRAMRMVIQGMPATAVPAYLDVVGWRDPTGRLPALLHDVAALADPLTLVDIDVERGVLPKVGVELYVRSETDNVPRWRALFTRLVERGLASAAKADALLAWPGFVQESAANGAWAANLALGDVLFRGTARSVFWRSINHIKLSYLPRHEPEVKAYLGFGHNWFATGVAGSG
jgi:hypothetical protein